MATATAPSFQSDETALRREHADYTEYGVVTIPVEHQQSVHYVEPVYDSTPEAYTLLELVEAVSEVTDDEKEVIATVSYMLRSGRIRLTGNFRDEPIEMLEQQMQDLLELDD